MRKQNDVTLHVAANSDRSSSPLQPIAATVEQSENESKALDSNASEAQALAPDSTVSGEYVENNESDQPVERKVDPISRATLSKPRTTMARLHEMSVGDLKVLDALQNEGRQIIKTRLMVVWDEMSERFERGESVNGISGTGGKGMGKYLRSIGVDPAKRRSWKFEIRQQESLQLAQENPQPKRTPKKKEIVIASESEADLIARAGVTMAQRLVGYGMMPAQERIDKAEAIAKEILHAIEGGRYERLEPLPRPTERLIPEQAAYADWESHRIPTPEYKAKYFADASANFSERYHYSFQSSAIKKTLEMLKGKPDQVLSHAQDFAQLAVVLRAAAENANLLAAVITTALNPPPEPEVLPPSEERLVPNPAEQREQPNTQQSGSVPSSLPDGKRESRKSESDSVPSKKVQQAESWLRRYLRNGPMPIPDSYIKSGLCRYNYPPDELPPEGIGKKTLDKAIINLGVQRLRTGPQGGIRWHLSPAADQAAPPGATIERTVQEVNVKG